jgi:hypothetical protein
MPAADLALADPQQPAAKPAPLKPGKSAGIHAAQLPRTGLALVGAGAIIAVVAVAASSSSNGAAPQANSQNVPVTTGTP